MSKVAHSAGLWLKPALSYQFSRRSRQMLGGPPMHAICCRLFQSASSSSVSVFCTYSIADKSPASSLTMLCLETQTVRRPCLTTFSSQSQRRSPLEPSQSSHDKSVALGKLSGKLSRTLTLRIWSSAVSICSSCCIFCLVTDWLFPFRSCMSDGGGKTP